MYCTGLIYIYLCTLIECKLMNAYILIRRNSFLIVLNRMRLFCGMKLVVLMRGRRDGKDYFVKWV